MSKEQIITRNINEWCEKDYFESAIQYAYQNSNIAGVNGYLSELQSIYHEYNVEVGSLLETETPLLNDKFNKWFHKDKRKNYCKWTSISCLVLYLMGMSGILPGFLYLAVTLGMIFGCIVTIIFKISSTLLMHQYNSYFQSITAKITAINQIYTNKVSELCNMVDNLFLASLDPAHRELLLMRRDQERQHQEAMQYQQIQLNSQQTLTEEQRRTRIAQEELLAIERNREKRRGYM